MRPAAAPRSTTRAGAAWRDGRLEFADARALVRSRASPQPRFRPGGCRAVALVARRDGFSVRRVRAGCVEDAHAGASRPPFSVASSGRFASSLACSRRLPRSLRRPQDGPAYVLDDAKLLSRSSLNSLNSAAKDVFDETGVRVTVVTLRKLQFETDAFAFADKVIETWYPTRAEGDKKVVLLVVKASKEGALVAGPAANKALSPAIESIAGDTIPFYLEQEKYGESLQQALKRVGAVLAGREDPGPPQRAAAATGSNFRSKQETSDNKGKYVAIVGGLLVISFVVPMARAPALHACAGAHHSDAHSLRSVACRCNISDT